jgi:hypothetical protein
MRRKRRNIYTKASKVKVIDAATGELLREEKRLNPIQLNKVIGAGNKHLDEAKIMAMHEEAPKNPGYRLNPVNGQWEPRP